MFTESHRHLAGAISPQTVWDMIRDTHRLDIANSFNDVCEQMLMKQTSNFNCFCTKFDILNKLEWHDRFLIKVARQVLLDIKKENIQHATLTVSLNKFIRSNLLVAEHVFNILDSAALEIFNPGDINYLLSINYSWPIELQSQMLDMLESIHNSVVGVDFVGDELAAQWNIYADRIKRYKTNKTIRAHVGERPGTTNNIDKAFDIGITRIAHGIYANDEQQKEATKRGIIFDMSLYSNIYTNAIPITLHPLCRMLDNGCQITLGTDDPIQFRCTIRDEYMLAEELGADATLLSHMSYNNRVK